MTNDGFGTIIQIGDILVSEDVICEYFSCDYALCKGACCIIGESGAPLDESELPPLEENYPFYKDLMQPKGRAAVLAKGFFEIDIDNDIVTPLVQDTQECAYTHFEPDGSCLCSIEKAGCEKPISCALYPIRTSKWSNGMTALNVHHWDICKDAYVKGRKEGVRVFQFLRGPLIKAFGEEFYSALSEAARRLTAAS